MTSYAKTHTDDEKIRNSISYAMKLPKEFQFKLFSDYLNINKLHKSLKNSFDYCDWMLRRGLEWEDYEDN